MTPPAPSTGHASGERITVVGPVPPLRGGIAHHTASLVRALLDSGALVQVISHRRLYPRLLFPGRSELAPVERALPAERVLTSLNPARWLLAAGGVLRSRPALVVLPYWHSLFLPQLTALLLCLRAARTPTLVLAHNLESHERGALDAAALRVLSSLPSAVLVHASEQERALLAAGSRAEVLREPHPPYAAFSRPALGRARARQGLGLDADERVLLCFGLVRRYKGVDVALEALARLPASADVRLLVVGEHYLPAGELRRHSERLGVSERVTLHDRYVDDDEVHRYFEAADALLAPYRRASHSGPIAIARAFGLPVIASDVGGLREQLGDGAGAIVPPEDPAALADAVLELLAGARSFTPAHEATVPAGGDAGFQPMARRVLDVARRCRRARQAR